MKMVKYGPYTITEEEYHKQIFCNGKPGNPSVYHDWKNTVGTLTEGFAEKCTKCGKMRWIVKKIPNYDELEGSMQRSITDKW